MNCRKKDLFTCICQLHMLKSAWMLCIWPYRLHKPWPNRMCKYTGWCIPISYVPTDIFSCDTVSIMCTEWGPAKGKNLHWQIHQWKQNEICIIWSKICLVSKYLNLMECLSTDWLIQTAQIPLVHLVSLIHTVTFYLCSLTYSSNTVNSTKIANF